MLRKSVPMLVLLAGIAVTAEAGQRPSVFDPGQTAHPKPFSNLFQPPSIRQPRQTPAPRTALTPGVPRIACGTVLVPVDPNFDSKIRRPAPTRPKPASKNVQPPACER